jgi:uncharacterized membrane protein (DUF106 family)
MEQTNTSSTPSLLNHALRFGAIFGGIGIVSTMLLYAIDYTLLANWKTAILLIVLYFALVIYSGINYRNQIGGYISYGKAFQHSFIVLAIGGLVSIIFSILLYSVIDPELPQKLTDVTVENTEKMLEGFGVPEDKMEESLDKIRESTPKSFSPVGQLINYLWAILVYAVISAITSLFVKKNEPLEF